MIKKYEMINPMNVVSVSIQDEDKRTDEYVWLCKLVTKETILLRYNPLLTIKQFVKYGYAVTHFEDETNEIDFVNIEQTMTFIDYYGFEVTQIKDTESNNTIIKNFDTYVQADRYILEQDLKKLIDKTKE
ncbi:MAG TPA: hypothetical protein EYG73_14170 [Arcobacter sp.]|nr:hypothetical protein [Arcobacter sp.]